MLRFSGLNRPSAKFAPDAALEAYPLDIDLLVPGLRASNKIGAIKQLVDRLHRRGFIGDSLQFLQSVLERENLESTILAEGVALPHARCHSVHRLGLAVGVTQPPLEYPSGDDVGRIPVICLIAVPADAPSRYLDLMGLLAHRLSHAEIRAGLRAATTATELQALLARPYPCYGCQTAPGTLSGTPSCEEM